MLSLLLIVAILALCIRLWQTNAELESVKPELEQLRAESGVLNVEDPDSFNVIQVPTDAVYTWRWRVRIPDDRDCTLVCIAGKIPTSGVLTKKWMYTTMNVGSMTEREVVLDISVAKTFRGVYGITASYNNRSYILVEYDDGPPPWLAGKIQYSVEVAGDGKTEVFDADSRAPILRLRSTTTGGETHGEGILVWLSTDKKDSPRKVESENAK